MRILKYIFLLILLSLVALSIFIATQKGEYYIVRSKIINASKSSVYNYINDYKNWEDFGAWAQEDPEMKFEYGQITSGVGATYSWDGEDGNGTMTTLFVKESDSISQKMNYNDSPSNVYWKLKDTIGGTKVTWSTKGHMSFMFKIYSALKGGPDAIVGKMYEKSLDNLDKALDFEINTFDLKENGVVKRPVIYYLAQTFNSEIAKVHKNAKIVTPKINDFCVENGISVNGKPFIIYHSYDLVSNIAKVSICVPIDTEIFISPGSDILSGKLEGMEAVKTTLTGDYIHAKKAYDKALAYVRKNELKVDPTISHIELFTTNREDVKNPSKWVTEIYIPLFQSYVAPAVPNVRQTIPAHEATEIDEEVTEAKPVTKVKTVPKPATEKTQSQPTTTATKKAETKKIETKKVEVKKTEPSKAAEPTANDEDFEF
ncbi:SRPBCC family protein [Flavobacterium algicola]|uniref:SRPBCC family protein n=1 Tax=Flavobacterium algicola TaxID=556529 RepID=UPI001EFC501C|nr:SRPBCC family protein [Flavobacterium algicola]MCG9793040.1 SRPBCC family protein [Flavobacterium algicola]